jgi:hypothetical protein
MALALEIAKNDPFTLRMLKWATNDRSGRDGLFPFDPQRTFTLHGPRFGRLHKDKLDGKGFPKVMPGVARALKTSQK